MIGIIIMFGGLFVLYQLGILKFGSSNNESSSFGSSGGLGSFIPSFKETKITSRLKKYTEYGALGYFSYIVLDGNDVSDFIGKFFNINVLFNSHQIIEK